MAFSKIWSLSLLLDAAQAVPDSHKEVNQAPVLQGLRTPRKCQVRLCGVDVFAVICGVDVFALICGVSPQLSTKELGFQRRVRIAV